MPAATTRERVSKRRAALRAMGMRPVQIWVPDTRSPGFEQEYRRQSLLVNQADAADPELERLMGEALADLFEMDGKA
jgi:hypothetical protein